LFNPSTDRLIIKCSIHFEKNPLDASSEPHTNTSITLPTPYISDDESTHSYHGSNISFEYDEHVDYQHVDVEPPQIPKWVHIVSLMYCH
jgi:hypothetical protein